MKFDTIGGAALVAALALALAPRADAQDLPFQTLSQGTNASPRSLAAQNTVIRSRRELLSSGLSPLLPRGIGTRIDWSREMLIAVVMGEQSTGGYGVAVDSVQYRFRRPTGPHPDTGRLEVTIEVSVERTSPAPGDLVTKQITNPYQVIKLKKEPEPVVFVDANAAQQRSFSQVTYSEATQVTLGQATRTVMVRQDGRVEVIKTHPVVRYAQIVGTASSEELARLRRLVRQARAASLPSVVELPSFPLERTFKLDVESQEGPLAGKTAGVADTYGRYGPRLAPLIGAIEAIGQRVEDESAPEVELRGTIDVDARSEEVHLEVAGRSLPIASADEAKRLRVLDGRAVHLRGRISGKGFTPTAVLSPRLRVAAGIVRRRGLQSVLLPGFSAPAISLEGSLARVARLAADKRLVVQGWLFEADPQQPELIVTSVQGRAKRAQSLSPQGSVTAGESVEIVGSRLSWAKVRLPDQSVGYLPMRDLSVGEPLAPARATVGASGRVGPR